MDTYILNDKEKEEINLSEGHEKVAVAFFVIFIIIISGSLIIFIAKINSNKPKSSNISANNGAPLQFSFPQDNSQNSSQNNSVEGANTVLQQDGPNQPSDMPPTSTPTIDPSPTPESTTAPAATNTPAPTNTPTPSNTPTPTSTPSPTLTPSPTATPSATPTPTKKPVPT